MRERILQILVVVMALAEALRGAIEIRSHLAKMRRTKATEDGAPTAYSWTRRSREWAAFAVVCTAAIVPGIYYVAYAAAA